MVIIGYIFLATKFKGHLFQALSSDASKIFDVSKRHDVIHNRVLFWKFIFQISGLRKCKHLIIPDCPVLGSKLVIARSLLISCYFCHTMPALHFEPTINTVILYIASFMVKLKENSKILLPWSIVHYIAPFDRYYQYFYT